jgi:cell pole-organizing protein PopZ
MNQPAKAQEPSMEEILASIRRIIADDDTGKAPPKAADPAPPAPAPVAPPSNAAPPPRPPVSAPRQEAPPPAPESSLKQNEIDAMLSDLNSKQAPAPPALPDVLELTEAMTTSPVPPAPTGEFRTIDGQSDVVFEDSPEPVADDGRREGGLGVVHPELISSAASAAVNSAFNSLAQTVLVQNARTLEDLVREMLRPMLKTWLDDNLPSLVERLVRAEIERVSRGRS